jgi:hypothetical protein
MIFFNLNLMTEYLKHSDADKVNYVDELAEESERWGLCKFT